MKNRKGKEILFVALSHLTLVQKNFKNMQTFWSPYQKQKEKKKKIELTKYLASSALLGKIRFT